MWLSYKYVSYQLKQCLEVKFKEVMDVSRLQACGKHCSYHRFALNSYSVQSSRLVECAPFPCTCASMSGAFYHLCLLLFIPKAGYKAILQQPC